MTIYLKKLELSQRRKWRYRDGFFAGMLAGTVALITIFARVEFPYKQQTIALSVIIAGLLFLLALGFLFVTPFRKKSLISPAGDGFVYGFVAVFDSISVFNEFLAGHFPPNPV